MNRRPIQQRTKTLLKTLFGIALLVWALKSKMIDFSLVKDLILSPSNLLLAFVFLTLSALLCTYRWLILIRGQGLQLSYGDLFSLNMIGNFFNTFMPGSVGGDLIKAWYVAGKEPQNRTKAVFTVLLDRILGLAVIILSAAFTLFVFSNWLQDKFQLQAVAMSIWCFSCLFLTGLALFFMPWFWKLSPTLKVLAFIRKSKKAGKLIDSALLYQTQGAQISLAFLLSTLSICSSIYFYSLQGTQLGANLSLEQYFAIVPLAVTVSAVPLLPGGIGTGQIAFFTLFKWMGVSNPELGGTLCTLVQIYTILFNCIGYFFYLRFKRLPSEVKKNFSICEVPAS